MVAVSVPGVRRKGKEARPHYETVVVYDHTGYVWRAELLAEECNAYLPRYCRFVPDYQGMRRKGVMVGAALFPLGFFLLGLLAGLPEIFAFIASYAAGILPGSVLGWWLGPKMSSGPFYVVYRSQEEETGRPVITPYAHSRLHTDPVYVVPNKDQEGNSQAQIRTPVFRASNLYRALQAERERKMFRSGMTHWRKIEVGAMITMGVATAGMFLFMILATQPAGEAPPEATPVERGLYG